MTKWKDITKDDVLKAIRLFDSEEKNHPKARNTFLIFNDRKYPAKHIRGMAYQIANNKEISKDHFEGGEDTAKFFKKLGFSIEYKGEIYE